jgi:hypothetical protein
MDIYPAQCATVLPCYKLRQVAAPIGVQGPATNELTCADPAVAAKTPNDKKNELPQVSVVVDLQNGTAVTATDSSRQPVRRKFRANGWADRRERSPKPFENHGIGRGVPLVP